MKTKFSKNNFFKDETVMFAFQIIAVFFISIFASFMTLGQETKKWSLEACIRHALEKNISIKQAQLEIETDEISKKEAFGSFLPTINAGGNHLWQIGLSQNPLTGILQNRTTQFTTFNASANIDLCVCMYVHVSMHKVCRYFGYM